MVNDKKLLQPIGSIRGAYSKLQPQYKTIIEWYINFQNTAGSLSTSSVLQSACIASTFLLCVQTKGYLSLSEVKENDIISFFIQDGKPRYEASLRYRLFEFLKTVSKEYPVCAKLADWLPYIRVTRKNIQFLTDREVKAVKAVCLDNESSLSFQIKAVGMILLYTGLRACDIAGLKMDSIDWEKETISVIQGKTDVPLTLPMHVNAGNAIYDYIMKERTSKSDHLFVTKNDKPFKSSDVSYCVTRIFKAAGIRQNKADRKGTHIFRHHLATRLLESEVPQPIISQTLGHTDPVSVQAYLSADISHLRQCSLSIEEYSLDWEVFDNV